MTGKHLYVIILRQSDGKIKFCGKAAGFSGNMVKIHNSSLYCNQIRNSRILSVVPQRIIERYAATVCQVLFIKNDAWEGGKIRLEAESQDIRQISTIMIQSSGER